MKALCCCGSLRLEIDAEPVINVVCHCQDCQRRTGSAFGGSMYFEAAAVSVHGSRSDYHPGNGQVRSFCPTCASTLFWTSPDFVGLVGVAAGALGGEKPRPLASYSDKGRCHWVDLSEIEERHE